MPPSMLSKQRKRVLADNTSDKPQVTRDNASGGGWRHPRDLSIAILIFCAYSFICFGAVILHCSFNRPVGTSFIWALASATVGGAFGFLFGIPKILQSDRMPDESAGSAVNGYRQHVNTNLTEISDWLTKIIVGLGLINLTKFPAYLTAMAETLAKSFEPGTSGTTEQNMAFAYAVIVCFSILGFLFGYLYTRLYLQGAFSRADLEVANSTDKETAVRVGIIATQVETHQLMAADKETSPVTAVNGNGAEGDANTPEKKRDEILMPLRRMAREYVNIRVADRNERLRRKNEMANRLCNYAVTNNISKDMLLEEANNDLDEGIILTLAHHILLKPEKGDMERLLTVARGVTREHVQYRIVQAIGQLFDKHCAATADGDDALDVLRWYEPHADRSLTRLIQGTRLMIERNLQQESATTI